MATAAAAASIEAFLAERTFRCEKLKVRMTTEECCRRQAVTEKEEKKWGYRLKTLQVPQDRYCASGLCMQGKLVKAGKLP